MNHPAKSPPLSVLVVEDDQGSADTLANLLRLSGHEAAVARSGPSAIEMSRAKAFDVVLLDLGLPGKSGFEVVKELHDRHAGKRPLIIAITGDSHAEDRHRSEHADIDLHLATPVVPGLLEGILRRFSRVLQK